jgi:hypothetical protein
LVSFADFFFNFLDNYRILFFIAQLLEILVVLIEEKEVLIEVGGKNSFD